MMNKSYTNKYIVQEGFFHRLFLYAILCSGFLSYFTNTGLIAYGPLIILMIGVVVTEVASTAPLSVRDKRTILSILPYVFLATFYHLVNPYEQRYLNPHLLIVIVLPFIVLCLIRLRYYSGNFDFTLFTYHVLQIFILGQLFICIGQISTYLYGAGLPVSETYRELFLITGTFYNPNDLGSVILITLFMFIGIETNFNAWRRFAMWSSLAILLLMAGSRSALLLGLVLFLLSRNFNLKSISIGFLFLFFVIMGYALLAPNTDHGVFNYIFRRANSLISLIINLDLDSSISLRLASYYHFVGQLGSLGIGTGEIGDYFQYSDDATFRTQLMFVRPHSLIVEIGYWLGWPGLLFFTLAAAGLLQYSRRKLPLIIILAISSSIPSSVLGNLIFFYFLIFSFFDSSKNFEDRRKPPNV